MKAKFNTLTRITVALGMVFLMAFALSIAWATTQYNSAVIGDDGGSIKVGDANMMLYGENGEALSYTVHADGRKVNFFIPHFSNYNYDGYSY